MNGLGNVARFCTVAALALSFFEAGCKPDKTEDECKKDDIGCGYAGECTPSGSKCVPGSDADCRQSLKCKTEGGCTLDKKLNKCVVGSDADCLQSSECKNQYMAKCKANVEYNRCEKAD